MSAFDSADPDNQNGEGETSITGEQNTTDYIKTLVETKGDHWADPQQIAKGKIEADNYVEELKAEVERLKAEKAKEDYSKELLELARNKGAEVTPAEPTNKGAAEGTPTRVSEDDIKNLVAEALTEREKNQTAAQNVRKVDESLAEVYGTEARKAVTERASELGMSVDRMKEIAAESPSAFMQLMGQTPKAETHNVAQSSINTSAAASKPGGVRNWDYYRNLRKTSPKRYYSSEIQNQLVADRKAMGQDKFYN